MHEQRDGHNHKEKKIQCDWVRINYKSQKKTERDISNMKMDERRPASPADPVWSTTEI